MQKKFPGEDKWALDVAASVFIIFPLTLFFALDLEATGMNYDKLLLANAVVFISYLLPCLYFRRRKTKGAFVSWQLVGVIGSLVFSANLVLFKVFLMANDIFSAGRVWEDLFMLLRMFGYCFIFFAVLSLVGISAFRTVAALFLLARRPAAGVPGSEELDDL